MIIKSLRNTAGFRAGDASFLQELLHPAKESLDIDYSLAHAVVGPGEKTLPHRLKSAEVYFILAGRGLMRIGDEQAEIETGQAVYIPPGEIQSIENIGAAELSFLCIVDPAWRAADEEILKGPAKSSA
jgi:mannose-6-phosphate isomerase-like protein (cupin superfamily)